MDHETAPPTSLEAAQRLTQSLRVCAAAAGLQVREPPQPPTTCCGRGCNGCVWEGFYAASSYWCAEVQLQLKLQPAPSDSCAAA